GRACYRDGRREAVTLADVRRRVAQTTGAPRGDTGYRLTTVRAPESPIALRLGPASRRSEQRSPRLVQGRVALPSASRFRDTSIRDRTVLQAPPRPRRSGATKQGRPSAPHAATRIYLSVETLPA